MRKNYLILGLLLFFSMLVSAQTYQRKTNLPTVYIETFNRQAITSKSVYIYATMHYVDEQDSITRYDSLQIRGRGNSTWNLSKKPYRIKFAEKEKFLGKGYAKAKSWTLMANCGDKTLIRNAVTSAMGEFAGMKFNPAAKFVDFVLNDVYQGTYQISDQVEVRAHRVNIAEQDFPLEEESDVTGGYLLEVDGFSDGNNFTTQRYSVPIRIHYPDEDEIDHRQNQYIRNYIRSFETVLASNDYDNPQHGYRQWIDSTSIANWYIATEMSANIDGCYSTYFYKDRQDSLLYFGPLWDYDIAYNNDSRISGTQTRLMVNDGYGATKNWVNRMWQDEWFVRLINRRFNELREAGLVEHLHQTIDSLATLLDESQQLNYQKWGISRRMYHEIVLYSSYNQYISDLHQFIDVHTPWLATTFAARMPEEPIPPFTPEESYYRIINKGTRTVFDVNEAGVCGWAQNSTRQTQEWIITPVGDYFQLVNRASGLALTDPTEGEVGPTVNVGTQLQETKSDTSDPAQLWILTQVDESGYFNLTNVHTQHTANLNGGSSSNGNKIVSYNTDERNSQSNNRQWQLEATSPIPTSIASADIAPYALAYNPVNQQLHFAGENPSQLTFTATIYTLDGRNVGSFSASESYSVAHLPHSTYIVTWLENGARRSTKFLKN